MVERIQELALILPDHHIAERLNAAGLRTQTGKEWTYDRVRSIRKQHHIPTNCPLDPSDSTPRGDGLVSVKTAAEMLKVSPSLIHLWAKMGILVYDQRVSASKRWVRVTEADLARLDGSMDYAHLPTITEVMMEKDLTRDEVWELVRTGQFVAYRSRYGGNWEWRLKSVDLTEKEEQISCVVSHDKGTP